MEGECDLPPLSILVIMQAEDRGYMGDCSIEGCERPLLRRGLCRYHYLKRWERGDYSKDGLPPARVRNRKEYAIWAGMKQRCNNPKERAYPNYGGRGIKVCPTWNSKHGFSQFLQDMGECPSECTLDRIDVNGDYCPENCRWAGWNIQAANKRKTKSRSSRHLGVSKLGRKWKAEIIVRRNRHYSIHLTEEEARNARKEMERKYLGKEL